MTYTVQITKPAERQLRRLDRQVQPRIVTAIEALAEQPRPQGALAMSGDMAGYYRIRVIVLGIHFRVVYSVDDAVEVVEVVRIGSREDIY